ncbi:hypothetical protein [Cyanobacterium aponinum]|uniref:hypothetical protein n=1 Tax=Cyanobacterium aponinum TaxID=379064 RepID=UPI0019D4C90C|nr:hypothetical protein [Cyanobacterium aponinum]
MTLNDILKRLKEPVAPSYISQKKVGNSVLDFISWFDYCDILDERCGLGNWYWEIVSTTISDNRYFMTGRLTIAGTDRSISQDATGTEILNCSSYGDPSSNAEAMALRRACAKFGLARELWRKDDKPNHSYQSQLKPMGKREITREEWLALRAKQG